MPDLAERLAALGAACTDADRTVARGTEAARTATGRRRELRVRIASALVLAPLGLACLALGGPAWDVIVLATVAAASAEWARMCRQTAAASASLVTLCVLAAGSAALGQGEPGLALVLIAGVALFAWRGPACAAGLPYVAVPGLALIWLRSVPGGAGIVLVVLLTVWASDTGAYAAGRRFGGRRLAPSLSPSKTWSGAAGGLAAAALVGVAAGAFGFGLARHAGGGVGAGAIVASALGCACLGVSAQLGDLAESAAKRRFRVKDSGRLIPGHGGVLDRIDGLMAAAALAALWMWIARAHGVMG